MSDTDVYLTIAHRQRAMKALAHSHLPEHRPQMLYFGCIDARLDPISDIGIEKGKLLIFRNIAALVPKYQGADAGASLSIAAALEFFLENLPSLPEKVKHIVISGHTDCGGLKACRDGTGVRGKHLPVYLENLHDVRVRVMEKASGKHWNADQILHALEEASVRQSVENLLTYPVVQEALWKKTLRVHGWVLDTATGGIHEMDLDTGVFAPMSTSEP